MKSHLSNSPDRSAIQFFATLLTANPLDLAMLLNAFLETMELSANTPAPPTQLLAQFKIATANHVTSVKPSLDAPLETMEPLNANTHQSLATTESIALLILAIFQLELAATSMSPAQLVSDNALKLEIASTLQRPSTLQLNVSNLSATPPNSLAKSFQIQIAPVARQLANLLILATPLNAFLE